MKLFKYTLFFLFIVIFQIFPKIGIATTKDYLAYVFTGDHKYSNTRPTLYTIDLNLKQITATQVIIYSTDSVSAGLFKFGVNSQFLGMLISNPTQLIIKDISTLMTLTSISEDIIFARVIAIPKKEKILINGQRINGENVDEIFKVLTFKDLIKIDEREILDPSLMFSPLYVLNLSQQYLYFSLNTPGGAINIVDTEVVEIVKTIHLDEKTLWPSSIMISTDNAKLFVQAYSTDGSIQKLKIIDIETQETLENLEIEAKPLALSPEGYLLYAISQFSEEEIVFKIVETLNYSLISTFSIGKVEEIGLLKYSTISSDGRYLVMVFSGPASKYDYKYKGPVFVFIFDCKKTEMNKLFLETANPSGVVIHER